MGRTEKWIAEGWVMAPFELPLHWIKTSTDNAARSRQTRNLMWMQQYFESWDSLDNRPKTTLNGLVKYVADIMKCPKSERELNMEHINRFTLSLLLSIFMSAAILENTLSHFKRTSVHRRNSVHFSFVDSL